MKYKFANSIRVRKCEDKVFFVNITNNNIFNISKPTFDYLQEQIKSDIDVKSANPDFLNFLIQLENQGILEKN